MLCDNWNSVVYNKPPHVRARISEMRATVIGRSYRKAMNRNWSNQKANPALKTKAGNKLILQIDKIQ